MNWYDVLKAARRVGDELTSVSLAEEAGIERALAAGWLSKFWRWGYVNREGKVKGPERQLRVYTLTRWGKRFRPAKAEKA